MKPFFRWTLSAILFLSGIILISVLTDGFDKSRLTITIVAVLFGSILLGLIFYLTETFYFPWRKKRLHLKLEKLFKSIKVSDSIASIQILDWNFLVQLDFRLQMSTIGNLELISFHIPREIFDKKIVRPDFKLVPGNCNGIETYRVYQTNGLGLKLAKKRIENKLTSAYAAK